MRLVWQRQDNIIFYVPTADHLFEIWMDRHVPEWASEPMGQIAIYRSIWNAGMQIHAGVIEEIMVYDRGLSACEVKGLSRR